MRRRPKRTPLWLVAMGLTWVAFVSPAAATPPHPARRIEVTPDRVLPALPPNFAVRKEGRVTWAFPKAAAADARRLRGLRASAWREIERDLGTAIDPTLTIRIARNPDEMRALAPVGAPPPNYAIGVAYPSLGIVLLTLTAPETWKLTNVDASFVHELSHVALHRAVRGSQLPLWLVEGLAIYQANEGSWERTRTLWTATVNGTLFPLTSLTRGFPSGRTQVDVAYAQSASFVVFLREGDRAAYFRETIAHVRAGFPFEAAVNMAYGRPLRELESEWNLVIEERFRTLPLVLSGGGLWALLSAVLVFAYVRRRRRAKQVLARWEREEAEDVVEEKRTPPPVATRDVHDVVFITNGDPPLGRESGVPTVEYEGRNHTLH